MKEEDRRRRVNVYTAARYIYRPVMSATAQFLLYRKDLNHETSPHLRGGAWGHQISSLYVSF